MSKYQQKEPEPEPRGPKVDSRASRLEEQAKWPITPRRAEVFLAHLRLHGIVSKAAYAASPHSKAATPPTAAFYKFKKMNPEFAAAWDDAIEHARGETELEIHRRGQLGVDKPVFYQGQEVATVREYSDALLLAKAKATIPRYGDKTTIRHEGGTINASLGLEDLSPESREDLRRILEREAARQAEQQQEPQ